MSDILKEMRYTYTDYLKWDDDTRYELIDGVPYMMSPAPSRPHQDISAELFWQLKNFFKGKPCKVYHAPFDVRLNADGADDTVVQPDILVVCDKNKLDDRGCKGAPDFIAEILSPSSVKHDCIVKLIKYQQAGVPEYWIIDPELKTVVAYELVDGRYISRVYNEADIACLSGFEGCTINLSDVFDE